MKTCPYCGEEIQNTAKKCRYCGEFLERKDKRTENTNELKKGLDKIGSKLWRALCVIYFVITVPIILFFGYFILTGYEKYSIVGGGTYETNYYYGILGCLGLILGYIIITDLLRRLCDFIGNGTFKGFINYKKLFLKCRYIVLLIIALASALFYFGFKYLDYSEREIYSELDDERFEVLENSVEGLEGHERDKQMWNNYQLFLKFKEEYGPLTVSGSRTNSFNPQIEEIKVGDLIITKPIAMGSSDGFSEFKLAKNKNISYKKTNFKEFTEQCINAAGWWLEDGYVEGETKTKKDYEKEEENLYKKYINDIISGTFKQDKYNKSFNPDGCGYVQGSVHERLINVDGVNGVVLYNVPTQVEDPISVIFQQIILAKSLDEIYVININYNFGLYFDALVEIGLNNDMLEKKGNYYEGEVILSRINGFPVTEDDIIDYLKANDKENRSSNYDIASLFKINDQIIDQIVDRLRFEK